ncbi:zinc ribbon domain-containing protein [Herpetosiphon llansteffanensis]|uniref:zinc ribbon domain-containing protein n=1 Tax=Herpetosiphon llansteffanensis TaxID=2094568 RepID=UPI00196B542B|nr:zinc ribbon domain-containing protein [Herpetosiphon llansteffanensis]
MKCYECGGSVVTGARFCPDCGAPFAQQMAVETRVLPPPIAAYPAPMAQQTMTSPVQYTPQPMAHQYPTYPPQQQHSYAPYPQPPLPQQHPAYLPQQAVYGAYPQQPVNVNIYNTNQQAPMVPVMPVAPIIVGSQKSVGLSLVLTFLFGPLGMFYSTVGGALTMIVITFIVSALTFGAGLVIAWPVCMIWGAVAASQHNQHIIIGHRY